MAQRKVVDQILRATQEGHPPEEKIRIVVEGSRGKVDSAQEGSRDPAPRTVPEMCPNSVRLGPIQSEVEARKPAILFSRVG